MSEDYEYENMPDMYDEELVIEDEPKTVKGRSYKRKPTNKQLETMRANLIKGREARKQKGGTRI